MREVNITFAPETDDESPWNIGLYDTEVGDPELDGYIHSVGATDPGEAGHMVYAFLAGSWDGVSRFDGPVSW